MSQVKNFVIFGDAKIFSKFPFARSSNFISGALLGILRSDRSPDIHGSSPWSGFRTMPPSTKLSHFLYLSRFLLVAVS